jgi:hypothetical protein
MKLTRMGPRDADRIWLLLPPNTHTYRLERRAPPPDRAHCTFGGGLELRACGGFDYGWPVRE